VIVKYGVEYIYDHEHIYITIYSMYPSTSGPYFWSQTYHYDPVYKQCYNGHLYDVITNPKYLKHIASM
jgi:hypothetical protein